ncbi:MAG: diacylglycerol kinase family protein [Solobacterium sp.]|nr:diacylglycerol kinase family protein [Solobacterium sp.]
MKEKFLPAFRGVIDGFRDRGIHTQYILALLAVTAGLLLKLSSTEWTAVVLSCGMVISSEILNTCVERICDMITGEFDERVKLIKDMAAGAVLVSSMAALITALIILVCHIGGGM